MNDEQRAASAESIKRIREQFDSIDWSGIRAAADRIGRAFVDAGIQLREHQSGGSNP